MTQPNDGTTPPDDAVDDGEQSSFIRPRSRRRGQDTEMDITPMIDVTFLLLIFFIVASKMDPSKAVNLAEAKHGLPVAKKTSVVMIIARLGEDEVQVFLGESKDPAKLVGGDLEDQDTQIEQYVTEQLHQNPLKNRVLIMCEQGVKTRHWHRVRLAAGRVLDESQGQYVAIMEKQ